MLLAVQQSHALVVEDEPAVRAALVGILESAGYRATGAPDGRAALSSLRADRPDIVIVDLGLPGLDGFQLISFVKRDQTLNLPVIVVTGRTRDEDRWAAEAAGADAILSKPVAREALVRLAGELLHPPPEASSTAG